MWCQKKKKKKKKKNHDNGVLAGGLHTGGAGKGLWTETKKRGGGLKGKISQKRKQGQVARQEKTSTHETTGGLSTPEQVLVGVHQKGKTLVSLEQNRTRPHNEKGGRGIGRTV